ncbi:MAG: hypothetical protein KJ709_00070 [Nanoarchaeota archaeon]|nr:hypothetical protein [Nanoarchaeota archaeon]
MHNGTRRNLYDHLSQIDADLGERISFIKDDPVLSETNFRRSKDFLDEAFIRLYGISLVVGEEDSKLVYARGKVITAVFKIKAQSSDIRLKRKVAQMEDLLERFGEGDEPSKEIMDLVMMFEDGLATIGSSPGAQKDLDNLKQGLYQQINPDTEHDATVIGLTKLYMKLVDERSYQNTRRTA